jgi:threonine/homoserine/homoserine lactone efflux protein
MLNTIILPISINGLFLLSLGLIILLEVSKTALIVLLLFSPLLLVWLAISIFNHYKKQKNRDYLNYEPNMFI